MGNKTGITLEEALKMLEAANSIIQSQQKEITDQQIKIDAQKVLIQKKEEELSKTQTEINQINRVIDKKNKEINKKNLELEQKQIEIEQKRIEIIQLQEKLATQLRYRFCAHSEKMDNQPSLFDFEDERFIPTEEEIEATVAGEGPYKEEIVKSYKRRKCGRKKLSEDLPRKEIYLDIPEEEKQCACGTTLVKVGEDRSERLQVIPAQIYVEVTVRPKYACRNCEGSGDEDKPVFRQMPAPKNIISKSISTPNLLAFIFSQKFCEHNPYYRQSKAFERRLIDISRADMDNWQLKVYEKLKPLEKILMNHIKSGPVINMDETTVKVLKYENAEKNKDRKKSYMWLACGGPKKQKAVIYRYHESRNPKFIKEFINGFTGWLQTDEYGGYEAALEEHAKIYPDDLIIHVACLAHVRRKFHDAVKCGHGNAKDAEKALAYIQKIYFLENRLREQNLDDEEFISERKKKILPVLNELHDWLVKIQPTVIPELKFGKAINYALNSWEHILNYIECPEIYVDNSIAERSIKPFVLGRKNWLFAGSEDGARSSCLLFSLIECAKIHNINPEDYLRCIFEQAANTDSWSEDDWKNLLPWNIKITSFIPQGIWISSKRVEN